MKQTAHILFALVLSSVALAETAPQYQSLNSIKDVFTLSGPGFMITDVSYKDWREKQTGLYFPMNVSPVFSGIIAGVKLPKPDELIANQFKDQEKDFAEFVNAKNPKGVRSPPPALKPGETIQSKWAQDQTATYVVQTVIGGVINRPFNQLGLGPEKLTSLAKSIDKDHFHYVIPGNMALAALDEGHIAGQNFNTNKDYLLSIFDLRKYDCVELKQAVDLYFKIDSEKQPLWRQSIYLISDLQWNDANDLKAAEALFGRRPTAVMVQRVFYADHLVKGAENIFVFFAEDNKTRAIFISNLGLSTKLLVGKKAEYYRPFIFDGMGGGWVHSGTNAALAVGKGVDTAANAVGSAAQKVGSLVGLGSKKPADDGLGDLLDGANAEMKKENKCDRGLGLGLIKYSQSLFSTFIDYLSKTK